MTLKILLCFLCIAALPGPYGCSRRISAQKDLDQKLIAAIERDHAGEEPVTVRMKDLTAFEWDKFYVFVPYNMRPEELRETLGIVPESSVTSNDSDDLLVFVKSGKVVHYNDHPRKYGEFSYEPNRRAGYSPDEAVFEVTRDMSTDKPVGRLVLRLKLSKTSESN